MRARLRVGRLLLPAAVLPGAARGGHGAPRACPAPGGAPPPTHPTAMRSGPHWRAWSWVQR